ncbi:MAG: hypothetical protein M4579_000039 [Chaenotheca gracillima]|nr:MAG: hypothetical protein M4579_000039 [Chaenotheca gracillima]
MEKYSQFRDRGSGIAPFFPVPSQVTTAWLPVHALLFAIRLPIFVSFVVVYFLLLQFIPLGSLFKKAMLWSILGVPGVWWIDLQIDGVKRGSLAKQHALRLPHPSDVIASSFTSPIDALYLAAIFDPIFTASYPGTRGVRRISLLGAILRAFSIPHERPADESELVELREIIKKHPRRIVVVFPECTTTNGRGILPFSPSLLGAATGTKIFPISLRYTPGDVTTPVPQTYGTFLWNFLSQPTHCIRVRIAECVYNTSKPLHSPMSSNVENFLDTVEPEETSMTSGREVASNDANQRTDAPQTSDERKVLDRVADALARLGRSKRLGLTVKDKVAFVQVWGRHRRR